MQIKRLLHLPKFRILKKMIGYDEIYTIALRNIKKSDLLVSESPQTFKCIRYSKDFWYADPISFSRNGKDYLFAEAFDRRLFRGHIVACEITDSLSDISFKTVIKESYHMSFPMVFEWNDAIYMIPETSENKSLNLYRAINFPYDWMLEQSFDIGYGIVDTIITRSNGKLELLSSKFNSDNPLEVKYQRFILYKDSKYHLIPFETYNAHYNLSDRNAGRIFTYKGIPIIPTQESTEYDYGVSVVFKKNVNDRYVTVKRISPSDINIEEISLHNIIGVHTYSKTDKFEIIDLRYLKFSPLTQWRKIFHL